MKQQYKKIADNWEYIKRADDLSKTISEKAQNILAKAMYQINRYGHAILTHERLQEITRKKYDQNRNLLKQLNFILETEFFRCLIINDKKYINAYKVTLKENAAEILENPKKYFVDYQEVRQKKFCSEDEKEGRKNSASEPKKFSSRAEKISPTSDSLHIYNKNKDKINNNKYYLNNLSSSSIEKSVKTIESRIANSEYVKKSHNGLAREECVHNTQDKILAKEDVAAYALTQQKTPLANQTPPNSEQDIGDYHPMLLKNFPLTDQVIEEVLCKSSKPNYTIGKVRLIVRNILETTPNKPVYGGKAGLVKYLVQSINNHIEYDNSDYTTNIFQKKHLTVEEQRIVDESWTSGKIRWSPC
jgi:hypothetical protein